MLAVASCLEELVLAAVHQNGCSLRFASAELRADPDLCLEVSFSQLSLLSPCQEPLRPRLLSNLEQLGGIAEEV